MASSPRWPTLLVIASAALFVGAVLLHLRGPRPGVAPIMSDPAQTGQLVVQLLRDPVDVGPFSVTDFEGRTLNSSDWRGKVVMINFWATWCPPCLAEIPDLVALQEQYRDRLLIVGISEDQAPIDFVKGFAAQRKINYPLVMTTPELRERFTGIVALPTTFVLDQEGRLVRKHVGLLRGVEAEAITRALTGLPVDAIVERVDDPGKLSATSAAQITSVPGVDLEKFQPAERVALIQELNSEKCTCGCDLSVAKCRIDDPTCEVSLPVARSIVEKFAR